MLPRLQAEERLNAITDGGVAAGTLEVDEQKELVAALREDAGIAQPKPAKPSMATLASMGIAVIGPTEAAERAQSDG